MSKIEINSEKKELKITIAGLFENDDAALLIDQLNQEIKNIDLSKYTLILDAKDHKSSNTKSAPLQLKIIQFLELYKTMT